MKKVLVCVVLLCVFTGDLVANLVGTKVDVASSAYKYSSENPKAAAPEAWLPIKYVAGIRINQPFGFDDAEKNVTVQKVLGSLLWEEIRPISQLKLTWAKKETSRPAPNEIEIVTLINQGTSSSWWNNIKPRLEAVAPTVIESGDECSYVYDLETATCGIVVVLNNDKKASTYSSPKVQAFIPDTWKQMNVEVEWGFQSGTEASDYSGKLETYDGRIGSVAPLANDSITKADSISWKSSGKATGRRGIVFPLLYTGTSKWRQEQPYTSQADDVARTIVTLWTNAGNMSFLAADLENGPIYAPEYGLFIRKASEIERGNNTEHESKTHPVKRIPLTGKMDSLLGLAEIKGWQLGENQQQNVPTWLRSAIWDMRDSGTPWFATNTTDRDLSTHGITIPANTAALHPGATVGVGVSWMSPVSGNAKIDVSLAHCQQGSNGIKWRLVQKTDTENVLFTGETNGSNKSSSQNNVPVKTGDSLTIVVEPITTHYCCALTVDFNVEIDSGEKYTLRRSSDNQSVWDIFATRSQSMPYPPAANTVAASEPPIRLDSKATTAREYLAELELRELQTTRQQVRKHDEQTWEGAMRSLHGVNYPPFPTPPAEFEPSMQVHVPSAPLNAQWRLGYWHMVRHCHKHPQTGRLWFNDFPYGILAAETYLILNALDFYGAHNAAADGFDQWLSLPMELKVPSTTAPPAFPDRPTGLFTDGRGCMTLAVGPGGYGGDMDGVHAFGPGSIGWALVEHYRLSGDKEWLRESAPRILANCEWMLRQRKVNEQLVPGGERLWAKGLLPALQVTPDSGGLWMQFYECEAYYWAALANFADVLGDVDPDAAAALKRSAEEYKQDLLRAVDRSIALSPVAPIRDGTFHSVIPFGCYMRGLGTGPWGWLRDGSDWHVGPLYWETVQSAAPLVSPVGVLPVKDVRVQGWIDVLEDRLMRENPKLQRRIDPANWFMAGWHYQGGLERTANMHLLGDDVPAFLRTWLNLYAINILPDSGYIFNEHTTQGPPDKIFEEAAFLERFRNLLIMEDGERLWITRGAPRAWFAQGEKISVQNAPTHFGNVSYEIVSDIAKGKITVDIAAPTRKCPSKILLKLRHPEQKKIAAVNSASAMSAIIDNDNELILLRGCDGNVKIEVTYCE